MASELSTLAEALTALGRLQRPDDDAAKHRVSRTTRPGVPRQDEAEPVAAGSAAS
jgi:hypothetical protein